MKEVLDRILGKAYIPLGLIFLLYVFYKVTLMRGYMFAAMFAAAPLILLVAATVILHPRMMFVATFFLNYTIMGINRYYSMKSGMVMVGVMVACLVIIIINQLFRSVKFTHTRNWLVLLLSLLLCFYILQLFRPEAILKPWFLFSNSIIFLPFVAVLIICIFFYEEKYLKWFLLFWGVLTLAAAAKGYWQKTHGFDSAEMAWLWAVGYRTHFLVTGIRYFSFFTDAANFGTSMGISAIVYAVIFLNSKEKLFKWFCFAVAIAAGYGLLISGTRSAMAVPFVGLFVYVVVAKNWKYATIAFLGAVLAFCFFKYTKIGEGNTLIRRARTAVNYDTDASFQVRLHNQAALREVMQDYPWGVGVGLSANRGNEYGYYPRTSSYPTDSWMVMIWVDTGMPGLIFYLVIFSLVLIGGAYILLFRIKNAELRGILGALLAGYAGGMAGGYANEILGYPNGALIYCCAAYVYLGPVIDKEITLRKLKEEEEEQTAQKPKTPDYE